MDYTDTQLEEFETIINDQDNALSISTYVDPDGLVITDGEDSIRISQGKQSNEAFIEADGDTNMVGTTADNRVDAVGIALQALGRKYDADESRGLVETALAL